MIPEGKLNLGRKLETSSFRDDEHRYSGRSPSPSSCLHRSRNAACQDQCSRPYYKW